MEKNLSKMLKNIKIVDNLDQMSLANIDDDRSIISSAYYYNKILQMILNNFSNELHLFEDDVDLLNKNKRNFGHLQLTLQKYLEFIFCFE